MTTDDGNRNPKTPEPARPGAESDSHGLRGLDR